MNYRHEFHAGNFADVFKHILLSRILAHLGTKPAPFRYIETHAGSGLYELASPEAGKTAEWSGGIGKLAAAKAVPAVVAIIEHYLHIEAPLLQSAPPRYGGSPWIGKSMLRRQDKMLLCECHPRAYDRLKASLGPKSRAKLFAMDGYAGLRAFVPPVERRGLVLIDPPFEAPDEFARAAGALEHAWRKWSTGIYMLWYPVKDLAAAAGFGQSLAGRGMKRVLRLELQIGRPSLQLPLARCGAVVVNPPFRLGAEADILLPWLAGCLGTGEPGFAIDWLNED